MGLLQQIELELLLIKKGSKSLSNYQRGNTFIILKKLDLVICEVPVVVALAALVVSFQRQPFAVAKIDLQAIRNAISRIL